MWLLKGEPVVVFLRLFTLGIVVLEALLLAGFLIFS